MASFPSLVVLLISVFVFPLIIESAAFVSATNYLITSRYSMGIDVFSGRLRFTGMRRYTLVSGILLVLCMAAISIGVSLGLQRSVYFFFGSDMSLFALSLLFFVNGMKGFRVRMGRGTTYTLAVAAAILMILWFVPPFTYNAYTSPVYFSLMGISAFLSAFLTSLSYLSLDEQARHVYMEFVAMMFSMVALVVFYVTVVGGRVVWGGVPGRPAGRVLTVPVGTDDSRNVACHKLRPVQVFKGGSWSCQAAGCVIRSSSPPQRLCRSRSSTCYSAGPAS
ncbi:hypothetical protein [Thermogymnomonas acidicola]|uniref:hypothetical protein n=1 Tax=Thermogymnomonas acidicola TaxID=399579 RepID=UPI0009464F9A|nr:hypothetical protein [Thermogymnomonas acidicola]